MRRIINAGWVGLAAAAMAAVTLGAMSVALTIGSQAPDFKLADQDGKQVSLSSYLGKIVVLEWTNPTCPFVKRHYNAKTMQTLAAKYKDKGVAWIAVNSTRGFSIAENKKWADEQGIAYPVLDDSAHAAAIAYQATNTPEMFIVDKDGKLVYQGAIDNDPQGDMMDGKINYVDRALSELTAGKAVSVAESKPYGCGVHYK